MIFQSLVGEYTCWTNFCQVSTEFTFQHAVFCPAEVHVALGCEYIQVITTSIVFVESYATITLDASIHFVIDERSEILILMRAFQ